jgi:hypothetical protein
MPELISALDDTHSSISSSVFHSLQRLAVEKPEYFERYSTSLVKQLGSINKTTRAESAKLIGIIAKTHPEYVCKAMPFLQSLASFYPDSHVKRNANEAYQIIWRSVKKEIQAPVVVRKVDPDGKGFADIVKLNAATPNAGVAEVQFTDDELREIIELTRKEFKSDAEAILNSLGVGHLAVKGKESRKKASQPKAASPEPVPARPKKEEKAFIMPQSGIASAIKREVKEPVPARPKKEEKAFIMPQSGIASAIKREVKEPVPARPKKEEKGPATPRHGIVDDIMQEVKGPEVLNNKPVKARGDPKAGRTFKCPKCGKHVWAEGQLCNSCGAEEFDSMRLKGHYDIGG